MKGEEAVRRLLAGEPDALEAIATAFTPLVHYVISAILEDPQEREECVADILHQVWQAREQFEPEKGSFTTWLTILARQRLQQAIRKLPHQEQVLFYRKYYYLQSTRQIAAEMGTSERAVEGKLYRLRKKLQKALGGEFDA